MPEKLRDLVNEATELPAIFGASIKTAKLDTGEKYFVIRTSYFAVYRTRCHKSGNKVLF